jgi:RNA polymerase sigma factor (sigma-70 family)
MLQGGGRFATTRWSLVRNATDSNSPRAADAQAALDELCRLYWPPVYAYLRRRVPNREAARDLSQAFFARMLERDWLARADPERGSFRAFLVTLVQRFAANELERERALVRGGAVHHVPIGAAAGDGDVEPATDETPEQSFDRAWVRALLASTLATLRAEHAHSGSAARFEAVEPHLVPGGDAPDYGALAAAFGVEESTARVIVFRARRRYRDLLRAAVAETLVSRDGVDAELDALWR